MRRETCRCPHDFELVGGLVGDVFAYECIVEVRELSDNILYDGILALDNFPAMFNIIYLAQGRDTTQ
jgi:hypothetical protein